MYRKKILQPLVLYLLLCLFVVTVEMRPGRAYQLLQMLLFRDSLQMLLTYLFVFCFTVWTLHIALLNKSRAVSAGYLFLLFPLLSISLSYRFVTGYNYAYADAQIALNNLHLLEEALHNFFLPVVLAVVSALVLCLLAWLMHTKVEKIYHPAFMLMVLPAGLLSYWMIDRTIGSTDDMPVLYRVPLSTLLASEHKLPMNARQPVAISPKSAGVQHLILIVDESITGSYLSLNGYYLPTTPYLEQVQDSLVNFGVVSAYTNQSAGTNIALMSGLQLEELPDQDYRALTKPSIFQYARHAGYTTYFIDAQIGKGILQNYMSLQDLQYIDHFIQISERFPELPYYMRDFKGAALLQEIISTEGKAFVYFNKAGAHWPYARTYPPDSIFFSPVLSEHSMLQDGDKSRNTYFNAIRWTVDGFWKNLLPSITPQDSVYLLYTSDHGQDLSGEGISISHASIYDTAPIEGDVPLWAVDKSGYGQQYPAPTPGRQHHAQIFPTLLLLQGYDTNFIRKNYGATLFDREAPLPRFFLSGDIFGRGPYHSVLFEPLPHEQLKK